MTQKEFEDRTGLKPTPEEFNYIHALYMNTDMDKDEFCNDFKKHGASSIMKEVHAVAVNFKVSLQENAQKSSAGFVFWDYRTYGRFCDSSISRGSVIF